MKIVVPTVLFLALTLSACGSLPPPPGDLSTDCVMPDIKVGANMINTIGEQRTALKICNNKVQRWNSFYKRLR